MDEWLKSKTTAELLDLYDELREIEEYGANFVEIEDDVYDDSEIKRLRKDSLFMERNQTRTTEGTTLDYYNKNANTFAEGTINVEFTDTQDRFLKLLPEGAHILDFGCGSGRDTKYFMSKGFLVDAADGSEELCRIASELTGISVRQMLFIDLDSVDVYDGIWACSSILHCLKEELKDVIRKMIRAVRDGGVIYTSFKYGSFEGERNGRYFTYFTTEAFHEFMIEFPELGIEQEWVSADVRPGRGDERWLNLILRKTATI